MQHNPLLPLQALNKAYLRLKAAPHDVERFKAALCTLLDGINPHETEEQAKNHLRDFLLNSFYGGHGINTKGRTGLVIHTGQTTESSTGVLLEVKRPGSTDMPTTHNLNDRAVHKLLLSYLQERVQHKNHELRHLVVTDVHEWFVFDALEFDRVFLRDSQLLVGFSDWSEDRKLNGGTDFFCREIAAPAIASLSEGITYTHFDLRDYEKALRSHKLKEDVKLVQLYKLLSPPHLLNVAFRQDEASENSSPVCYAQSKELRKGFTE
jgi:adenine-specific DNA-methyltransferase